MKSPTLLVIVAALCMIACSTTPRERAVSITAKPSFKSDADFKNYHFETDGFNGKRSIFWPDAAPKPNRLNKDRFYTLELLEEEWKLLDGDPDLIIWSPELVKVREGEKLLYDASICRKHRTQMERKLVKISYGLPSLSPEWKALRENAPNDGTVGGCSVDVDRLETRTWVCSTCKSILDEAVARRSKNH